VPGDIVQLTDAKGRMHTITLEEARTFHTHRGRLEHDEIIGAPEGSVHRAANGALYVALRPHLDDFVLSMPRGAAVIYPKDSARIVALANLGPGSRVTEAGLGSGALTCSLLRAVGAAGHVTSYERRAEFADVARANVAAWFGEIPENWDVRLEDFSRATAHEPSDAVILDMVAPWECLDVADALVRPGGALVGYVTTTTQLSRLVEDMRERGTWTEPRAEESLVRTWHLNGLAVRPDHRMIGHTAFLVTARHLAPGHEAPVRRQRPAPGAHQGSDGVVNTDEPG
jgi:tRNA (adenine57-N1/adenine58-N1)-methyltransferase catalytic subunit